MNFRTSLLQTFLNFNYTQLRSCKKLPEGIKYHGFTYYPRTEDFKDPPYDPSKLFLVIRKKSLCGVNYKEKHILSLLNVDGQKKFWRHMNVVKNIPSVNALLWKVKHLVEIKPVTWKGELPKDGDYSGTYLKDTGELVISPKLKCTNDQLEATEQYLSRKNKLDRKYFRSYLRKKWDVPLSGHVNLF